MIQDEGRLYQMLFHKLLKQHAEDIAFLMSGLILNMILIRQRFCFLVRLDLRKVDSLVFLQGIHHRNPLKRLLQVNLHTVVYELRRAENLLRHLAEHRLNQFHHSIIIGIRLI